MAPSPCRLLVAFAAPGVATAAGIQVVSGYASKMWEEARAVCPQGTWLEHCSTIPSSDLGAYPTADARGCVVTALSSSAPVRAVALCGHSVPFAEGRPTIVVESHRQYEDEKTVVARCGDEQQFIVSCNCHSFWGGVCKKTSWLPGANGCVSYFGKVNTGRRRYREMGTGGKVFAICRALTVTSRPASVGSTTTAFCPPGTWVYRCQGMGSVAPSEDGRSCAATSDGRTKGFAVTRATCGPVRTWVARQDGDFRDNAVLSTQCSHGTKAVWCACESPSGACDEADFRPTSLFGCSKRIPGVSGVRRRANAGAKIHAICEWPEVAPSTCKAVDKGRLLTATPGSDFTVRLCSSRNYLGDIRHMRQELGGLWQTQQVRPRGTFTVRMLTPGRQGNSLEVMLTMRREDLYLQEIRVGDNVIRLTERNGYLPPQNGNPAEFPESYEKIPKPSQLNKWLLTANINDGDPQRNTWFLPYIAVVAVAEAARFEMVSDGVASLLASDGMPKYEVGAGGLLTLTKNWNAICKDQGNHVEQRLAVPWEAVKEFAIKTGLRLQMKCLPVKQYRTVDGSQCVDRNAYYGGSGSSGAGSSARRLMAEVANASLARRLDFV